MSTRIVEIQCIKSGSSAESTANLRGCCTKSDIPRKPELEIKVNFNDQIQEVIIQDNGLTYDELVFMLKQIFGGQIKADDEVTVKYEDEDGDMVTMVDSHDLGMAIDYSRVLKLQIFAQAKTPEIKIENEEDFRRELFQIRNAADRIFESLIMSIRIFDSETESDSDSDNAEKELKEEVASKKEVSNNDDDSTKAERKVKVIALNCGSTSSESESEDCEAVLNSTSTALEYVKLEEPDIENE